MNTGVGFSYADGTEPPYMVEFLRLNEAGEGEVSVQLKKSWGPIPLQAGTYRVNYQEVRKVLSQRYENEYFIHILPNGETPSTHHVRGSNECHIGIVSDRIENRCIIVAALDNLTKGSSGQAVQNANLMLGIDEAAGLNLVPLFP